jgi:hypothetical protein
MAIDPEAREIAICQAIMDDINEAIGQTSGIVTAATNAEPIEITTNVPHGFFSGATVTIAGVEGNEAANGSWSVTVVSATKFTLNDSEGDGAYTEGGTWAGQRFRAQQAYSTDYKLSSLKTLRVDVRIVPESEMEAGDRQPNADLADEWYRFEISVQQAANAANVETVNTLIRLMKRIQLRYHVNHEIAAQAIVEDNEVELYNQVCLRDHDHFHGVLNLRVKDYSG